MNKNTRKVYNTRIHIPMESLHSRSNRHPDGTSLTFYSLFYSSIYHLQKLLTFENAHSIKLVEGPRPQWTQSPLQYRNLNPKFPRHYKYRKLWDQQRNECPLFFWVFWFFFCSETTGSEIRRVVNFTFSVSRTILFSTGFLKSKEFNINTL